MQSIKECSNIISSESSQGSSKSLKKQQIYHQHCQWQNNIFIGLWLQGELVNRGRDPLSHWGANGPLWLEGGGGQLCPAVKDYTSKTGERPHTLQPPADCSEPRGTRKGEQTVTANSTETY